MATAERQQAALDGGPDRIDMTYRSDEYFCGMKPSSMCYEVLKPVPPGVSPATTRVKVLDLGCGEGKDAVFLARNGYDVTGLEISAAGLDKARRLADGVGVEVELIKADLREFRLDTGYDVLFSDGVSTASNRSCGLRYSITISSTRMRMGCTLSTFTSTSRSFVRSPARAARTRNGRRANFSPIITTG